MRRACWMLALAPMVAPMLGGCAHRDVRAEMLASSADTRDDAYAPDWEVVVKRDGAPSRVLTPEPAPQDRWDIRQLGSPRAIVRIGRPPHVGKKDVRIQDASIANALRLLAEVGRFSLVVHEPLNKKVSLVLRNVEPYDALVTLATVHGLGVAYADGIVTVRKPNASP